MSSQLALRIPGEMTPVGITIEGKLSYSKWEALGEKIRHAHRVTMWYIGDWYQWGEINLPDKYTQALNPDDFDANTLKGYASVCRSFADQSRRRDDLSFSHHKVVHRMKGKEADLWLAKAAKERWTVAELQREIRRALKGDGEEKEPAEIFLRVAYGQQDVRAKEHVVADCGRNGNDPRHVLLVTKREDVEALSNPTAFAELVAETVNRELT